MVVCATAATGCGGEERVDDRVVPVTASSGRADTSTATTVPAATSTTLPQVEGVDPKMVESVWDGYVAAQRAFDKAAATPNPNDPEIAATYTNAMLDSTTKDLRAFADEGQSVSYPAASLHTARLERLKVLGPQIVQIDVCLRDDAIVAVKASGEIIDDDSVVKFSRDELILEDGHWKSAGRHRRVAVEGECVGV